MAKKMGFLMLLLCLAAGGLLLAKPSKAAGWNENKMLTVKKGAFTFKAYFSKDKKKAWIYEVVVKPKKGSTKTLKFPARIKGKPVTKLGHSEKLGEDEEFYSNIFNVVIEEAHDCDGYRASIKKIQKLVIPKTVKEFTHGTFSGLHALKKVTLPAHVKELPVSLFYGCPKLKSVTLPNKLKEFCIDSFADCPSIRTMKISKSNKKFRIKKGVVLSKDNKNLYWVLPMTDKVSIPNQAERIWSGAFGDCGVEKLMLPASVQVLEAGALSCVALTDVRVDDNNPVYARDGQCIYHKSKGELAVAIAKEDKVVISSKVTELNENSSLAGSNRLDRVDIPVSVKRLVEGWMFFPNISCKVYFHSLTPPQIVAELPGYMLCRYPFANPVYVPAAAKDAYIKWAEEHDGLPEEIRNGKGSYEPFMDLHTF